MLNRRKAFIGYLVYSAARPFVRRALRSKAKSAVPGTREGSRAPNAAAVVAAAGAVLGGLLFWSRRRSSGAEPSES